MKNNPLKWELKEFDQKKSNQLQKELNISGVICQLLVQRNLHTFDLAKQFFRPQLNQLYSPWLMKDMQLAVDRILLAIQINEPILIFGDYDVDGTTSVATLYNFLTRRNATVDFYIPHRYREGYGISKAGIDYANENKFKLIISVDCGIKSVELIQYAKQLGIDFIVCDHHLPDNLLPPAVAILNPKQINCTYPFKDLCGCGVVFKLITALTEKLNLYHDTPFEYLDLVATAIAADIVSLTDENRILAFYGLKKTNENPNLGIEALLKISGLKNKLQLNNLVFIIAPRVNAAGRMDDAKKAVHLFISKTTEEAIIYAQQLNVDNTDRKEADHSITTEALELIKENILWQNNKSTVLYQPHWHKGVVGIVASRIIETYYKPTVILTKSGNDAAGSARSVPGFNLYDAIYECREYLISYGGHFAAAGLTLKIDQIDAFRNKFEEVVSRKITNDLLVPKILIDAPLLFSDINPALFNILQQMEPFGPENMRPVFIAYQVTNTGYSKIVKEAHIRFSLQQGNQIITGIGFNMANKFNLLENNTPIDIVFKLDKNEWNGVESLQLNVIDFRPSV